jgi:hypothetical protein
MVASGSASVPATREKFVRVAITHHDHGYVECRGGALLYSHLRGAPPRCRYRREALLRAQGLYKDALDEEGPSMRVGGLGLLVLQRAVLAAEDLAVVLHALAGAPPSFERLANASYKELDVVFETVRDDPGAALEPFLLPPKAVLEDEEKSPAEVDAAIRLVALTRSRWQAMLERVAALWLGQRVVAKATMHGIPLVAGEAVLGPPAAGVLATDLPVPRTRPFAVAVLSQVDHKQELVLTDRHVVRLDDRTVDAVARGGKAAIRLVEELSATHATSIERGYGYGIPFHCIRLLPSKDRALLERSAQQADAES